MIAGRQSKGENADNIDRGHMLFTPGGVIVPCHFAVELQKYRELAPTDDEAKPAQIQQRGGSCTLSLCRSLLYKKKITAE